MPLCKRRMERRTKMDLKLLLTINIEEVKERINKLDDTPIEDITRDDIIQFIKDTLSNEISNFNISKISKPY